jgi:hypothetical protein
VETVSAGVCRIVSYQNDGQARTDSGGGHRFHVSSDFRADFSGDFVAVEEDCGHALLSPLVRKLYMKTTAKAGRPRQRWRYGIFSSLEIQGCPL